LLQCLAHGPLQLPAQLAQLFLLLCQLRLMALQRLFASCRLKRRGKQAVQAALQPTLCLMQALNLAPQVSPDG
jgi:hypothetical protein